MRTGMLLSICLWAGIAYFVTGCAGVELGGKLGMYRVDERKESQATYQRNTKPLKCWFVDCSPKATEEEVQGS